MTTQSPPLSAPADNDVKSATAPVTAAGTTTTTTPAANEQQQQSQPTPPKRKPSRRANTAERRATHNAVERARRETLNGRFLDLAGLLPNLSQIRRPSKSAIVNSSIAHINASKRHRVMAARELRALKGEADALRRELNEWRDRAALPRIEEPLRGEGFGMVLSGELEVISIGITEEDEDGEEIDIPPSAEADSPENTGVSSENGQFYHDAPAEPTAAAFAGHQGPPTPPASSHGVPHIHPGMPMHQRLHPMVVNTQQVHFDPAHPNNMHGLPQLQPPMQHQFGAVNMHPGYPSHHHQQEQLMQQEKAAWNMGYAAAQAQRMQVPPSWNEQPDFGGRGRSGSMSGHSFTSGSPPRSPGSTGSEYELGPNDGYGMSVSVPRGLSVNTTGMGGMHGGMLSSPISIGHGGPAYGNGMAMGMM